LSFFTFEKSIGAVIFVLEKDRPLFLLLHYPAGHWGFVKGHIEKRETDEMTLRREAKEETGLVDLEILPNFLASEIYYYKARGMEKEKRIKAGREIRIFKRVVYYLAKTNWMKIRLSDEHQGFSWLQYDQALERISNQNSKKVLEKAQQFLTKHLPKK
jgi:8-oxo-dGTP pyrophosphatase MutT (NUDIX family)